MKKRMIALLLSMVMILPLGNTAFAESVSTGDVSESEAQTVNGEAKTTAAALQTRIDALPDSAALAEMSLEEQQKAYEEICDLYDAIDALGGGNCGFPGFDEA